MSEYDWLGQTTIYVCEGVPLDNSYTDTILFESAEAQNSYFLSKAIKQYTSEASYQRVSNSIKGSPRIAFSCRVPCVADEIYNANYLCFQNKAPTGKMKWFYCFIREINFINPHNTEIIYEIDYFQTYWFDINLGSCFVEREHSKTDIPFENTQNEPFGAITQTINQKYYKPTENIEYCLYYTIPKTSAAITEIYGPGIKGNLYVPYNWYKSNNGELVTSVLKGDLIPAENIAGVVSTNKLSNTDVTIDTNINVRSPFIGTSGTYEVRNKKLLSSQFTHYIISSTTSEQLELKPELIDGEHLTFNIKVGNGVFPKSIITPNYKASATTFNQLVFDESQMAPYTTSAFASWVNNSAVKDMSNALTSVIAAGTMAVMPEATPLMTTLGFTQAGMSGANFMSNMISSSLKADSPHYLSDNNAFTQTGESGIYVYRITPTEEMARKIDMFFDLYGYATNEYKIPNIKGRTYFNYVKTKGCIITGSAPVPAISRMKEMFNNGVRLWHNGNEIGNYNSSVGNPIT